MSKIKLEIPADNPSALLRTADMLVGMADDLRNGPAPAREQTATAELTATARPEPQPGPEPDPTEHEMREAEQNASRVDPEHNADGVDQSTGEEQTPQHNTAEVDANGLPYDPRIHSRGKTFYKSGKKSGCWKYARNVNQETIDRVEAELRQLMAIPSGGSQPEPQPEPSPQPEPQATGDSSAAEQAFGGGPQPEPNPEPSPQAQEPQPQTSHADDTPATFQDFMHRVTAGINAGTINTSQVTEVCKRHGVAALPMLATRPDLIPAVWPEVKAQMGG